MMSHRWQSGHLRATVLLMLLISSAEALAQDTVSQWAYRRLSKAHEALSDGKYREALELMQQMKERKRLNDHERALMWQTYGFIYSGQEKYDKAADAFEQCLALNALPEGAQLDTQFNLGQLYLGSSKYKKAVAILEDWFNKAKNPAPNAYFVMAMAYAQQKNYKKGLYFAQQAVARVTKPQESWLQLLLSLYFELKQYSHAVKVLKQLIESSPTRKSYWMQLSAVYNELGDQERALAVMELAYRQGLLTRPNELVNLAQFYLQYGMPLYGADTIKEGIQKSILEPNLKNKELLASCLINARNFQQALQPLGEAAKLSDKGDLYIQLAQLHMADENWKKAAAAVDAALKKGKLTDEANAQLLLGIIYYSAKNRAAARRAFEKAATYDKTRRPARQWLRSLEAR